MMNEITGAHLELHRWLRVRRGLPLAKNARQSRRTGLAAESLFCFPSSLTSIPDRHLDVLPALFVEGANRPFVVVGALPGVDLAPGRHFARAVVAPGDVERHGFGLVIERAFARREAGCSRVDP